MSGSIVTLNVGGHMYTTTRSTLTRYPDSMLGAMFGGDFDALRDDQGRYFIDRNGRLFEHVLNFLRTSQLVLPEDFKELPLLEIEADFYQIQPLIEALRSYKARSVETNPCEVVFLNSYPDQSGIWEIVLAGSSEEVREMAKGLRGRLDPRLRHHQDKVAALLGWLQDAGFTVQSHVHVVNENYMYTSWVLVRKTVTSSDRKGAVGKS